MTIRLVALMSVVLLLSLAAFGLLINHHQDQVMEEVRRTVSEVSRATVRTLEGSGHDLLLAAVPRGDAAVWQPSDRVERIFVQHESVVRIGDGATLEGPPKSAAGDVKIEVRRTAPGDAATAFEFECFDDPETGARDCRSSDGSSVFSPGANQFFIRVDEIHAEPDAADGLVLKIPRLVQAAEAAEAVPRRTAQPVTTRLEEIRLPIPVAEYEDLFHSVRNRSLWLFVGVFAVGTMLSAGLATRFTRPIRRLDGAIRRLSDGDLAVEVQARGDDEIARLGRAFNEMTRSLRSHRERSRDLTRREKQSALGRLAAGVAHDIRNPLHSINLTLQHLQETCRPAEPDCRETFDESLAIIRGEIRRLDSLVGNFLGFARSEPAERRPVDLAALLEETANLVRKEAEWRRITVRVTAAADARPIDGDPEAIRSSLLNLVLNSFEAMPDGGELRLDVRAGEDGTTVEVSDTGHGIARQDLEKVFDFAYTTREGGNGLGLAMVHHCVVEEHGGRVELDSDPGRGTRIAMIFPAEAVS